MPSIKAKNRARDKQKFFKFEIYEVKADIYKDIASSFSVFSIPTILVFLDSKEFFRKSRNISISAFIEEIRRPYSLFVE